ncbi:DUF6012 family protein [Alteromonas macleodii]|uniref:DUF6012 family protein n=1 Tax=Alteromonas macleodii TaxID=28108 RepID=UPI003140BB8C|tara:strand:- start:200703 stop:201347 length:645 start_codon:yes stop_codon:yes gene_type:complete
MIAHLTPRIYNQFTDVNIELESVYFPDFALTLSGETDLALRKPYPNKCFHVACKRKGSKAINGILLNINKKPEDFTMITTWIMDEIHILTHEVIYTIIDKEFDYITDNPCAWYSTRDGLPSRWGDIVEVPALYQPSMNILFHERDKAREHLVTDTFDEGILIHRKQNFACMTVERERLFANKYLLHSERMPQIDDAFVIASMNMQAKQNHDSPF